MKIRATPSWSWSRAALFGGGTCAPIAHDIYEEILKKENADSRQKSWRRQIEMTTTPLNERRKLDRLQLAALAGLMFIGTLFVYSATMANPRWRHCRGTTRAGCGRSSGMRSASARARRLCLVDYHTLARWSFVAYWATIFFLVAC
jgi:cell division protein FtsW (lipid II flippase)